MPKRLKSKPWWSAVRKALYAYPNDTNQERKEAVGRAINRAKDEMTVFDYSCLLAALMMVYFRKTNTLSGAALLHGVSHKTMRRIIEGKFFFTVAEEMGFIPKKKKGNKSCETMI